MLEIINLTCVRDERTLFSALNFRADAGDIVQIDGPNGAGKTSLLRLLAGLSQPESGAIHWHGTAIARQRERWHRDLLYLGHYAGIKAVLTPRENLAFLHATSTEAQRDAALESVDLLGYETVPVAQLSAGQQRRVALARLWLSQAPLWILDEPLTAIDKQGVSTLIELFEQHAQQGGMVLLTTHQDLQGVNRDVRKIRLTSAELA